ncbi:MAG TPA: hypothetical protein PK509_13480 [Catalimonadaceae bacterium]|nr:hypothetical protein [Catalimonadaceae bacterium]HPI10569.1 hypothetical protein [Catalimonadaceae bacterium]
MYKKHLFLLIAFTVFTTVSYAQYNKRELTNKRIPFEDLRKKKTIRISPFHLFDNQFNVSWEFFNPGYSRSHVITASIIYADNASKSDGGFSIDYQGRIYPRTFKPDSLAIYNNSASGFYMGLGLQAGYCEFRNKNLQRDIYTNTPYGGQYRTQVPVNVMTNNLWVNPYIGLGYQFILWESLYADLFVGGGLKINNVSKSSPDKSLDVNEFYTNPDITDRYFQGIIPKVNLCVGVGF